MRLLSLRANQASFKPVVFNRSGLSLVVAEQHAPKTDRTGTYNGVGKSLMFELIHYCFASNAKPALVPHLDGWTFTLRIEVASVEHEITRTVEAKSKTTLDGKAIALTALKDWLGEVCFEGLADHSELSFRSLISRFLRSGPGAYSSFFHTQESDPKDPYGAMLRNAFLLGLDIGLASEKKKLRTRQRELNETMTQLQKEPLFAELLTQDTVDIELVSLRERIAELRRDLDAFRVADDYHDIEQDADEIKRKLNLLRRTSLKLREAIAQVERSLQNRVDLNRDRVYQLYSEIELHLPEQLKKRVNEVLDFHEELQRRRVFRLTKERQTLETDRGKAEKEVASVSRELDEKLRYLGDHRALDEYAAVNQELAEVQQRVTKLEESKALRARVNGELRRISRDLAEQNIVSQEYLDSATSLIDEATKTFRSMTRELYGARPSGLRVDNDEGENTLRYKIDAHITADAAEGINEAKLFCYDMTLLSLRRGHRVDFMAHDSTLFGPIDPRQRLAMFRVARRLCEEQGSQYVATLNMHDISSIREQLDVSEEEFEELFDGPAVVLRLADDKPENKLLGIDVDMTYLD